MENTQEILLWLPVTGSGSVERSVILSYNLKRDPAIDYNPSDGEIWPVRPFPVLYDPRLEEWTGENPTCLTEYKLLAMKPGTFDYSDIEAIAKELFDFMGMGWNEHTDARKVLTAEHVGAVMEYVWEVKGYSPWPLTSAPGMTSLPVAP